MKIPFQMRPIAHDVDGSLSAWTIHVDDGFNTQIATRLERRAYDWRLVFKDEKSVTVDTERDAMILIQGVLIGRCLA